jgi:hypothetical protein
MHPYPSAPTAMHFIPVCYFYTAKLRKVFESTKSVLYIIFNNAFFYLAFYEKLF